MRQLLFAGLILLCAHAAAQSGVSIGAGTGDCREVARQIVRDWMDVGDLMAGEGLLKRPSANQFQCVAPTQLQGAMPRRAGSSDLRCYSDQRVGVCCDAQMRSCATLRQ
jgi:hypothetical protein